MAWRERLIPWLPVAAAGLAPLCIVAVTDPFGGDVRGFEVVADALRDHKFDAYQEGNRSLLLWPYPPGLFPWLYGCLRLESLTGILWTDLFRVLPSLANAGLAWVIQDYLRREGAGLRERVLAATLVALGPSFLITAGYHGQIDTVAILPAVAAFSVWKHARPSRRAVYAGLLLGIAGTIKTVPLVLLIALLPSARSRREGLTLAGTALVLPALALAPFIAAAPKDTFDAVFYKGYPSPGGLALLVQPDLIDRYITGQFPLELTDVSQALFDYGGVITAIALIATAVVLARRRLPPPEAALIVWLAVYAFGVNFFLHWAVWGLPFLLLARRPKQCLLALGLLVPPAIVQYWNPPQDDRLGPPYAVYMGALTVTAILAFPLVARRLSPAQRSLRSST